MNSHSTTPVVDQVRRIASDLLGVPLVDVNVTSSPKTISSWDSTMHLNLVLAIEEQFEVQLSPEEIEGMHSIGEAAAMLEKKLATAER